MKVLVTGHHGYIGSVLTAVLDRLGHEVSGLDTFYYRGCDFGGAASASDEQKLDVREVTHTDVEGFDAVVHLAALSNDPLGDLNPQLTDDINLTGTLSVARAARKAGVPRFIFASSCSMYGASGTGDMLDENAPLRPLTPYASSKVRAEEALMNIAGAGFSIVSMRNATVYGVSPRLRLDIVLNNLAAWAVTTGSIRILSDGKSWRPLIHVRDVARVVDLLLRAPDSVVSGHAFNIGSNEQNYVIRDLAEILAEITECEISVADGGVPDPRSYRVDFSKLARAFPDFVFESDARRGARELVDAYRAFGMTLEHFEGSRYVRLRRLRRLLDTGALDPGLRWTSTSIREAS